MLPTLIVLGVLLLVILWLVGLYNGLIALRNRVQEAWAQIDTELKRRHDLIGNLVETVKGYAQHERGTLEAVTQARAAAMAPGLSPAQSAKNEAALTQALVRLNAVAEAYPDLKANQSFLELQRELTSTEDRIASARRYYNANVRELNTKVESIPTNVVAGFAKIGKAEYFEAEGDDRDPVKVDFGSGSAPSVGAVTPPPSVTPPPAAQPAGQPVQDTTAGTFQSPPPPPAPPAAQ